MLWNRSLLSLVAVFFFSTFFSTPASANSTNVATAYLRSGPFNSATGHSLMIGGKTTAAVFVAYEQAYDHTYTQTYAQTTTGAIGGARIGASASERFTFPGKFNYGGGMAGSKIASVLFPQRRYGPTCCEARSWVGSGRAPGSTGPGLPTSEPGSLMLAATGLAGIAGMLRRKLRLG
jgi:hypothetical protein